MNDPSAILPIKPSLDNTKINKVKVKNRISNTNIRSASIISYDSDSANKELLLRAYQDFMNNIGNESLHADTGDRKFNCFRQILGPTQQTSWDALANAFAPPRTNLDFTQAAVQYISAILGPGPAMKQKSYLERLTNKPFPFSPEDLWNRLTVMNILLIPCLDNPNGILGPLENSYRRNLFERLMPSHYKDDALKQGVTASNQHIDDSDLVQIYQNLYTVELNQRNKRSSSSYLSNPRGGGRFRSNNYSSAPRFGYGGYSVPSRPIYPSPPRPFLPARGFAPGRQVAYAPGRGRFQGFQAARGRGGGRFSPGGRSTASYFAHQEAPEESQAATNDIDAYATESGTPVATPAAEAYPDGEVYYEESGYPADGYFYGEYPHPEADSFYGDAFAFDGHPWMDETQGDY